MYRPLQGTFFWYKSGSILIFDLADISDIRMRISSGYRLLCGFAKSTDSGDSPSKTIRGDRLYMLNTELFIKRLVFCVQIQVICPKFFLSLDAVHVVPFKEVGSGFRLHLGILYYPKAFGYTFGRFPIRPRISISLGLVIRYITLVRVVMKDLLEGIYVGFARRWTPFVGLEILNTGFLHETTVIPSELKHSRTQRRCIVSYLR